MLDIKEKAISGFGLQSVNIGLQALMNILFLMVMARLIDQESFGVFAIASILIQFIGIFSEVGIGSALVQRDKYNQLHLSFAFYATLLIGTLLFALIYVLSPLVVKVYDHQFSENILRVIGLNLVIMSLGVVSKSLMIRELEFKKLLSVDIFAYLIGKLIIGITLALLGFGVWALIYATLCHSSISTLLAFILKPHSLRVRFAKKEIREIMYFGTGLTITRFFNYISNEIDKVIIGKYLNMQLLGLYERASVIVYLPGNYMATILDRILFSIISRVNEDDEKSMLLFFRPIGALGVVMIYISMLFLFFSEELVLIFLGQKWLEIAPIFQILSLLIPLKVFVRLSDALIRAKGAVYRSSVIKLTHAVLVVMATFIGLKWGLKGVAYLIVVAYLVNFFMMLNLSIRLINSSWYKFFQRLIPGIRFGVLLLVKNIILIQLLQYVEIENLYILLAGLLLDLIIIIALFIYKPVFFGRDNILLLIDLLGNIPTGRRLLDKIRDHLKAQVT